MIRPMTLHITSQQGMREHNEDEHSYQMNLHIDGTPLDKKYGPVDMFAIFDGHGIDGNGHAVAKYVPTWIRALYLKPGREYPISQKALDHYYDQIEKKVEADLPEFITSECGTTALVGVRYYDDGEWFQVVNLGDCRAVVCRDGYAISLSKDHKPSAPEEAIRIAQVNKISDTKREIIREMGSLEYRVGGLSVSRGFGDTSAKPQVSHLPETLVTKLTPADRFIIMACDGLWETVTTEEAVNFVSAHLDGLGNSLYQVRDSSGELIYPTREYKSIAKRLAKYAIAKGSGDNVTAFVIVFETDETKKNKVV